MSTFVERYQKCPRNTIPKIVSSIEFCSPKEYDKKIKEMGIESKDDVMQLLLLEIARLKNNMVACRKAAKRALKDEGNKIREMRYIVEIVNKEKNGTTWWP